MSALRLTLEAAGPVPRELPAQYRCPAAVKLFVADPAPMRGEFLLEDPGPRPLAREVAVLLMQSLLAFRGPALRAVVDTDDPAIIADQLEMRLASLPVRPTVKPDAVFVLSVSNPTNSPRTVYAREFELPRGWTAPPFPPRAELFNLSPGRTARVECRAVLPEPGGPLRGGGQLAIAAAATPEGVGAANPLTVTPARMRLAFDTHGYLPPADLLRQVAADAADRLRKISFERLAVVEADALSAVGAAQAPVFAAPLGHEAPQGAALLLARLVFAPEPPGVSPEFVAPGVDYRGEQTVRLAAPDRAAALAQLEAARTAAVAAVEVVLQAAARA